MPQILFDIPSINSLYRISNKEQTKKFKLRMIAMKKLIKTLTTLTTCLVFPLSLIATDISEAFLKKQNRELDFSTLASIHKKNKNKKSDFIINSVFFPAFVLDQNDGTGAYFEDNYNSTFTIPVIGLPSTTIAGTAGPEFTLGFTVPIDCAGSHSSIHVQFVTSTAIPSISGNVKLIAQVETVRPNQTLVGLLSPFGTALAEISTPSAPTFRSDQSNYYALKIGSHKNLRRGDFVYLTFHRDNSIDNNFPSDIFITGAELVKYTKKK